MQRNGVIRNHSATADWPVQTRKGIDSKGDGCDGGRIHSRKPRCFRPTTEGVSEKMGRKIVNFKDKHCSINSTSPTPAQQPINGIWFRSRSRKGKKECSVVRCIHGRFVLRRILFQFMLNMKIQQIITVSGWKKIISNYQIYRIISIILFSDCLRFRGTGQTTQAKGVVTESEGKYLLLLRLYSLSKSITSIKRPLVSLDNWRTTWISLWDDKFVILCDFFLRFMMCPIV